jgi:hypothetical protein
MYVYDIHYILIVILHVHVQNNASLAISSKSMHGHVQYRTKFTFFMNNVKNILWHIYIITDM